MIVKEVIGFLLLSGCLHLLAADNIDKSSEINVEDLHNKRTNNEEEYRRRYKEAEMQFRKDYHKWGDKKFSKLDFVDNKDYININEIDSKEYVDKYNKYGHTFNVNSLYVQNDKSAHNKKTSEGEQKHHEEHERPKSLAHDVDVNYVNNKKEMSRDSEFIFDNVTPKTKETYQENYQNKNELYMKRFKKDFYQNLVKLDLSNPPPPNDTVLMARYIVHTVDWAVLGTLSGRSSTKGSPFVCVKAISDGLHNESTGVPFFYMSPMDICTQDLQKDNRVSLLVTLSQTEYCKNNNLDPQDPRCAKLTLSGKIKRIKAGSDEEKFAKNALFDRHPAMKTWPADHDWYFSKLKIGQIILLDQFGGATYIKVKDYLNGKVVEPELKRK